MKDLTDMIDEGFYKNVNADIDKEILSIWNKITDQKHLYKNSKGKQLVIYNGAVYDFDELYDTFCAKATDIDRIVCHKKTNAWTVSDIVFVLKGGSISSGIKVFPLFRLPEWESHRNEHQFSQISFKELKELLD